MNIIELIFGRRTATTVPEFEQDRCVCGSKWFTTGGPVTTIKHNGSTVLPSNDGHVLCCLLCARKWFSTKEGLKEPHEWALPPAWMIHEMQRRDKKSIPQEKSDVPKPVKKTSQLFRKPPIGD